MIDYDDIMNHVQDIVLDWEITKVSSEEAIKKIKEVLL